MRGTTRKRLDKTIDFIREYANTHGYAPSMRDIQHAVGTKSTSTVSKDLRMLEEEGLLVAERDKPRAIQILDKKEALKEKGLPEREDKQLICDLLLPALQATRSFHDLASLEYIENEEVVIATFDNGYTKKANVAADSGSAMIKDILRQII